MSIRRIVLVLPLLALLAPARLRAQRTERPPLMLELGASFPSGGDFNDVYRTGWYGGVGAWYGLGARLALRPELAFARYAHAAPPGYVQDAHAGRSVGATLDVAWSVPVAHARVYAVAGAGCYWVHSAFLDISGTVLPATTQRAPGVNAGLGVALGSRAFIEVRHHDVFRRREGMARFIPVTLGWVL